jgi:penicillin-binding protein 2
MFEFRISAELKNRRIRKSAGEIEPQEIFLDKLAQKKESEFGISEKKIEAPLPRRILKIIFISVFLLLFFLLTKTFQLQVLEGKEFLLKSQENLLRAQKIKPERGVIYDQNLNQLVWNKPSFDLIFNKRSLPYNEKIKGSVLEKVSQIIGIEIENLREKIEEDNSSEVLISENLDHQTLILLETKINQLSGFQIEKNTVRDYLRPSLLAHLLGYVGKVNREELSIFKNYFITDYIGKTGLEKSYEKILRGEPGKIEIERDVLGRQLKEPEVKKATPGKSLILWLDFELQEKTSEALEKAIKNSKSRGGAAVAIDPKTGGVLALISWPEFDSNLFSQGISRTELEALQKDPLTPLFNRAIAGQYPSGSTIKPLVAIAALQENIISPEKLIYDPGYIEVPNQYNPEKSYFFRDWKVHGWTDMRKAIAESCNVYFYTIGGGFGDQEGLGPSRIKKYLQLFGWGQESGINLPGEAMGLLPDPAWKKSTKNENWWDGDTYLFSIGQGDLLVTPLQVASAFVAIANGGKLLKPKLVKKIIDSSGAETELQPEVIREDFVDPENIKVVKEGMREAVVYGSSRILNSLPVPAAAKTGTAQTAKKNYYHNWVTVIAPVNDPKIVLTVLIEEVPGLQAAALPAAKEILEWYFYNYPQKNY